MLHAFVGQTLIQSELDTAARDTARRHGTWPVQRPLRRSKRVAFGHLLARTGLRLAGEDAIVRRSGSLAPHVAR